MFLLSRRRFDGSVKTFFSAFATPRQSSMEQVKRFAFLLQPKAEYKAWIVTEKHFFKTATNPEDMRVTACFMGF